MQGHSPQKSHIYSSSDYSNVKLYSSSESPYNSYISSKYLHYPPSEASPSKYIW